MAVASFVIGPFGIAVDSESLFDTMIFGLFELVSRWYEFGATSERMDGGEFVCAWSVAVPWNILVCVRGFAIDVEV